MDKEACEECGEKTQPRKPRKPSITRAKTKVLLINNLQALEVEQIEKAFDVLLNNGYRPLISNNAMIVMVRAVQIPIESLAKLKAKRPKKK